jgi:hypothetical protein
MVSIFIIYSLLIAHKSMFMQKVVSVSGMYAGRQMTF